MCLSVKKRGLCGVGTEMWRLQSGYSRVLSRGRLLHQNRRLF